MIYIDNKCKCHTENPDNIYRQFDVPFFYGKCKTFIEGHRYCPKGESYVREDGEVFTGECIVAWKSYDELDSAQREYEKQLLADYESALAEIETALWVTV